MVAPSVVKANGPLVYVAIQFPDTPEKWQVTVQRTERGKSSVALVLGTWRGDERAVEMRLNQIISWSLDAESDAGTSQ